IEVQYEEIPEPIHEPIQEEQEFIIHEFPSQVNEMDVIDHEVVEAESSPLDRPIEERNETEEPADNEVPVLFHLEEEPKKQVAKESQPVSTTVQNDEESTPSKVKKYNLEDYIDPASEKKIAAATPTPITKEELASEPLVEEEKEEELTPMNSTITQGLAQRAEERRKKLKSFNYKFTTNRIDELENEPAYKRAQVDMNNDNSLSRLSVETDSSNETRIRTNNSFLHDNVD
ncbi:MAG: hypothetical protein VYB41_01255, partial [Bacteroidota bacterium]|nr:hypothetical protein [Bacteroidota bacterium]